MNRLLLRSVFRFWVSLQAFWWRDALRFLNFRNDFFAKTCLLRHTFFTFRDYYISIPTNNPNTFSFLLLCLSVPADRLFFCLLIDIFRPASLCTHNGKRCQRNRWYRSAVPIGLMWRRYQWVGRVVPSAQVKVLPAIPIYRRVPPRCRANTDRTRSLSRRWQFVCWNARSWIKRNLDRGKRLRHHTRQRKFCWFLL